MAGDPRGRLRRRVRQGLRLERLEDRRLLAGDVFLVNFQLDEATPVPGYLVDHGLVFGDRGKGRSYGWSTDHTDQARERSLVADQRFDTLIHFEQGQRWEFALPAGTYAVTVAVGDPANNDGLHTINVEGVSFWAAAADGAGPLEKTLPVTVTDGRLTIDQGTAAHKATRIDFVHIVGLPEPGEPAPNPPLIMEPEADGAVVNPGDVHMEAIGFSDPDGDAHTSTDWEIWTVDGNPEPVWQTLGIQSIEKLHTHFGDGIFLNSLAGRTALEPETRYQLRVRFRDADGGVSGYAIREFVTTAAFVKLPLDLPGVAASPAPTWTDAFGGAVELPVERSLLSPSDAIIAIDLDGDSSYPAGESPDRAVDGTPAKYLNFGKVNAGFIVSPAAGPSVITGLQIWTANDAPERDPTQWRLYGTNAAIQSGDNSRGTSEGWTLIAAGSLNLPAARDTAGPLVEFANAVSFRSYRMIFTGLKDAGAANSLQLGEVRFFAASAEVPRPASLSLATAIATEPLLTITGRRATGNEVGVGSVRGDSAPARLVIASGGQPLVVGNSSLAFTDLDGTARTVYLPAIALAADQRLDLWVGADGSTYYGTPTQTEPDFSSLARSGSLDIPFVATQSGFVVEEVGRDYRLPVNIAFVPNPGPAADDPLYFVTELYGSIQVVTRDGSRHTFATGLLDYNPQGPISGSGEQGLTGIAVERDPTNPEIYHLYVTMLWDNAAAPGGPVHYPKVERLDSVAGGLALATRTVLLNMQPETQGQSHQVSNISIGPDGLLYVHNGDGFDPGTALNLDSFRGKVLRLNKDGTAPADNPFFNAADGITARDYVFAYGLRNPFGGGWRLGDGRHFSVENGPSVDRLTRIERGVSYGWNGTNESMSVNALYTWSPAHAPVNIAFVEPAVFGGSQFPLSLQGHAFVSESGPTYAAGPQTQGKRIVAFEVDDAGDVVGPPISIVEYVGTGRATIAGLAAGPDGLYFTELYEDSGANGATASGARLFRLRFVDQSTLDIPAGQTVTDTAVHSGDAQLVKRGDGTLILHHPNTHTGGTIVRAGELVVRDPAALGSGTLEIHAGGSVRFDVGLETVHLPAINLAAGGLLDLGQARLEIAAGGIDDATLRQAILAARGSGDWQGGTGIGSAAAAADPAARSVGFLRHPDGSASVAFTAIGDLDLDRDVDVFDLLAVSTGGRFGTSSTASWGQGDVTYDGQTNVFDLVGINTGGNYGRGSLAVPTAPAPPTPDHTHPPAAVSAAAPAPVWNRVWVELATGIAWNELATQPDPGDDD
ncbi:MAG: hypothetical protein RLZZ440_2462 [Planctomycetota bacterium]